MPLVVNEHGELYDPADFEPPKRMILKGCNMGQLKVDLMREASRTARNGLPKRGEVGDTATCERCGKEFTLRKTYQKFCGDACRMENELEVKKRRKRGE